MTPNSTEFETVVVDLPANAANWPSSDFFNNIRLDANADGSAGVISFDYFRFTNENTLSIESQEMIDATVMYPNPVSQGQDVFVNLKRFTNADKIELSVNDVSGKLIFTEEVSGGISKPISTNNISAGVYLVSVKNDGKIKRFKIIVN